MKRLLATTALGMLLVASPALAQTSQDTPSPPTPQVEQNQPDSSTPSTMPPATEAPGAAGSDDMTKSDTAQAEKASPLDKDTLASKMLGVAVENASGETIGEINDILLGQDGTVKSALVGVGGFLGMGQKNVAIDFSELNIKRDDGNNLAVTVSMSAESLEAMPAYKEPGAASENETSSTSQMKGEEPPRTGSSPTTGGSSQ